MNRSITLALGAGFLVALLAWAPELSAGVAYAGVMLSVSFVGPDGKRVVLGAAQNYAEATDILYRDATARTEEHGDVAFGSNSEGVVATFEDGVELLYSFEPISADTANEARVHDKAGFNETGLYVEATPSYALAEVAQYAPTLTMRLALQRLDMQRPDGTAYDTIWNLVSNRVGGSKNHDAFLHPAFIPQLIEGLSHLYAEWLRRVEQDQQR